MEQIGMQITLTFIAAIGNPMWGMIGLYMLMTGRIIFSIGYVKKGAKGRIYGAFIQMLGMLASISGCINTFVTWDWSGDGEGRVIPHSPDSIPGVF